MSDPANSQHRNAPLHLNCTYATSRIHIAGIIAICVLPCTFSRDCFAGTGLPDLLDPSEIGVSDESLATVTFLQASKVDLNSAGVNELTEIPGISVSEAILIIEWRRTNGRFESVSQAAAVPRLSPAASEAVQNFTHAGRARRAGGPVPWGIRTKVGSSWSSTDSRCGSGADAVWCVPDNVVLVDANWLDSWRAGIALLVIPGITDVHASSGNGEDAATHLVARRPSVIVDPAGFIATLTRPTYRIVAGTYQVGFATGLTIDTTGLKNPDGQYPTLTYTVSSESGSIRKPKRFSGAALTFSAPVSSGSYRVSGAVFGSYSFLDPNRTDVTYNRCPAGQTDCGDSKKAPFVTYDNDRISDDSLDHATLTNLIRECTAGADIGFGTDAWRVEAIGWATGLRFRPAVPSLSASVSSAFPENRRIFGAFGLAGTTVLPLNGQFRAEIAITDQAAPAAVVEARVTPRTGLDLETSFRYYSRNWDNPWTGSTADDSEFRGNRTRNETGGRFELTWRSSRFTANHLRLDVAYADADDMVDSRGHVDIETITSLEVFPTKHERLSVQLGYTDRDLTRGGRSLSYSPYYSTTGGNISGGCRINWKLQVLTTRIPRTRLTAFISQTFEDVATLRDSFDMSMAATFRLDAALAPGPDLSAFFRWSDESMTSDNSPSPGQGCAYGLIQGRVPAACRGDTSLTAGLGVIQTFITTSGDIRLSLSGRYVRHIDDRPLWEAGDGSTTAPSRNEFAATLMVEFVRESRRRATTGNR